MRRAEPNRDDVFDLREVVVEHRADIFRYARSFCRNDADAEDLAQNAVLRALAAGAEVRNPERAKWYLLRIVRNLATDQARARARMRGGAVRRRARHGVGRSRARRPPPARRRARAPARRVRRPPARPPGGACTSGSSRTSTTRPSPTGCRRPSRPPRQRVYRAMQALRALTQQRQLGLDNP